MSHLTSSIFALPGHLSTKADPDLVSEDERHFAAVAEALEQSVREITERLDAERRAPAGQGQEAMDRDLEVHRLSARLRTLRRFGLDLCLGRIVAADHPEPVYVGRLGLSDASGRRLLVDWRSPAAEPFFAATHAHPMGVVSRRRYRWTRGLITDYWDEVFTLDGLAGHSALDDQSAFIASLGASRSPRMRDVLGTMRPTRTRSRAPAAPWSGGPGTGKTVVALHRAAYLLTPTRDWVVIVIWATAAAGCCSSGRTSLPATLRRLARRGCNCAGGARGRAPAEPARRGPADRRPTCRGDRARCPVPRAPPTRHGRRDALVRVARRRGLGRGLRGADPRRTEARDARSTSWSTRSRRAPEAPTRCDGRRARPTALGRSRADRRGRRP